jgi:hypothetical protein
LQKATTMRALRAAAALLGAAAVSLAAATGLDRPFPPMPGERPSAERIALGRLLFFDPVLSRDVSLSCAHCHRPDRGLADGLATARGRHGAKLSRNTPTLYNAAFKQRLMWDRRAASLEEQVLLPLLAEDELNADPAELVAELAAIPEYARRFAVAFPADRAPVSLANLARATASRCSARSRRAASSVTACRPSRRRSRSRSAYRRRTPAPRRSAGSKRSAASSACRLSATSRSPRLTCTTARSRRWRT